MAVVESNVSVPEVKPTRQWDAWTREEEENFFGALRQVGKNFEKITSRVQSKNKDQVRHYYYRVIKRMNRILGPTLILDAKNSAHVNSAMLRWWSLLEKHSCSASKLRLKPRRFKTFVTALEHQLLKDHKKAKTKKPTHAAIAARKSSSHGGIAVVVHNGSLESPTSGSGVSRFVADDLQSTQTTGSGGRAAVKRKSASSASRKSGLKGEAKRPPRPRKKPADGNLSKAAYAKWEKAASVGVSMMAEAAEQLERATAAEHILPTSEASEIHNASTTEGNHVNMDVQTGQNLPGTSAALLELGLPDKMANGVSAEIHGLGRTVSFGLSRAACSPPTVSFSSALPLSSPGLKGALPNINEGVPGGLVIIPELCAQVKVKSLALDATRCNNCSILRCNMGEEVKSDMAGAKLKLQLFPFDDFIRKALEQEGHNPHLELTFKARKSISSVIHHLTQKWGRSTVASGELHLFPFNTQWSNVSGCQSWSYQDLSVSAADVHAALGNPGVFRLRYAWLSPRVLKSSSAALQQHIPNESEPVLSGEGCFPGARNTCTLPYASTSKSFCIGTSAVGSMDPCRRSEEIKILPVSSAAYEQGDARCCLQPIVLADTMGVVVPHVAVPHVGVSEHELASKITPSNETSAVIGEKDFVRPVRDLTSFADGDSENVDRSNCKDHESASQVSGCGWLYESNDGFAQQLWNYEDTLRSSSGVSIAQMDWVDSLTNISVSELLGEESRAVFSTPLDCPQSRSGETRLTCLDSFDISVSGQESPLSGAMLMPMGQSSSSAIWGGDETCDGFSFQKLDRCSKEAVSSLGEEISPDSLGLDITFADFRSMACWREGDSSVALGVEQPHNSQSQDLLFGGEASMGLGGLIDALVQGSLDGFQDCSVNHVSCGDRTDQPVRPDCEITSQATAYNGEVCAELASKDRSRPVTADSLSGHGRGDDLLYGSGELSEIRKRFQETAMSKIGGISEKVESLREANLVNTRLQRKKELCPPQRSFKMPGQYSTVRSLKLQG